MSAPLGRVIGPDDMSPEDADLFWQSVPTGDQASPLELDEHP